jgi:hypothetical protein
VHRPAVDTHGLLNGLTSAFAAAGANVHGPGAARARAVLGLFQLTDGRAASSSPMRRSGWPELVRSGVQAAPPGGGAGAHCFRARPSDDPAPTATPPSADVQTAFPGRQKPVSDPSHTRSMRRTLT